jgi:hypothetical protein
MPRRLNRFRSLGLTIAFVMALIPAQAHGVAVGIADSEGSTFNSPLYSGLWRGPTPHPPLARVIVPYDIALRSSNDTRRRQFEDWLNKANFSGTNVHVGLQRLNADELSNPDPNVRYRVGKAPYESLYRFAFNAFLGTYGTRVDRIDPWNEPNIKAGDASRSQLPGPNGNYTGATKYWLDEPDLGCTGSSVTVNVCGPRMAAYYYRWAAVDYQRWSGNADPDSHLSAGEFAGTTKAVYIQRYKHHLGYHRPALWGVHNYSDVTAFQASGNNAASELKNMIGEIFCASRSNTGYDLGTNECGTYGSSWSSGHIWVTATGALYRADCDDHRLANGQRPQWCPGESRVFGEVSQCNAAAFIMRFANLDSRLTRVYHYTYMDANVTTHDDTGLTNSAGTVARKAYYVIRDHSTSSSCRY